MTDGKLSLNERTPGCNTNMTRANVESSALFASAAANDVGQLLHEGGLLRFLASWLSQIRTGGRCRAVGSKVWLTVLELSLGRSSLLRSKLAHALPLHLRIPVHGLPWASSWLGSSRSGLWERLIQTVVVNGKMSLLLPMLLSLHVDCH